ncbi:MAG: hypothetical protein HN368_21550, partial [Spirochaetales bacterium]|nr:hypothetical protein [Spirochaetales bacterium]
LMTRVPSRTFKKKPIPKTDGTGIVDPLQIAADDIDLSRYIGVTADANSGSAAMGELIGHIGPVYPEAWMSAIIGCKIYASAFGCTAKKSFDGSFTEIAQEAKRVTANYSTAPWYIKLKGALSFGNSLAEHQDLSVRQPHLRGVVDMVAAFLGEERLCMEIYDHPVELTAMAETFADLWLKVAQATQKLRQPWHGGYVSSWKLFAAGLLIDYQIDATSILSPDAYRDIFLPADQRIFDCFPYSLIHLHAVGLHALEQVLNTSVTAIQISLDNETGNWDKDHIILCCREIQKAGKALLIVGELSSAEIDDFLSSLEPQGLAIESWEKTIVEARP